MKIAAQTGLLHGFKFIYTKFFLNIWFYDTSKLGAFSSIFWFVS
jgi:hypothetical protein